MSKAPLVDDSKNRSKSAPSADFGGIGLLFAAALLWSLNGAFIKAINDQGRGPDGITIAFYRSVFGGLFLLPLAWRRFQTLSVGVAAPPNSFIPRPSALVCAVFFAAMTGCFVVANTMTEAGNAIVLQYTSTLWIFVLSPWLVRERPRMDDAWILVVAMIGVGVIFFGNAGKSLPGLLVALAAGFFYALLTLMIRRLRDADSAAITVLNNLGAAVLLFLPVAIWGDFRVSGRGFVLLALMGVVQFAVPYYLYALGLTRVPAYQAGLITLAEPILVPLWTYLAVGEVVPGSTLVGGGVLLISLALFLLKAWAKSDPRGSTSS